MKAQQIGVKFLIGIPYSKELTNQLEKSPSWKQAQTIKTEEDLQLVYFEKKMYIGYYITQENPSIEQIKQTESHFFSRLRYYLPTYKLRPMQLKLMSQVFVN